MYLKYIISSRSISEINTCNPYDTDSSFYCIPTGIKDCCTGDSGRQWSEAFAELSTSLYASSDYTIPSTIPAIAGSTTGVATTTSSESDLQAPNPTETHSLLYTSDATTASLSQGPETLASDINAVDRQVPPMSTALSTGAKAGIGVGSTIAVLLILGIGTAASIFYRRSKQSQTKSNDGISMEHSGAGYFAADRVIPEMDATIPERPAELEDIVLSEQSSSDVSRWAVKSQKAIGTMKGNIHELQA